jgi:hypothetical protein
LTTLWFDLTRRDTFKRMVPDLMNHI